MASERNDWIASSDRELTTWAFIEEMGEGGVARVWMCQKNSAPACREGFEDLEEAVNSMVDEGFEPLWSDSLAQAMPPAELLQCR